jgi:GNAT superfamily N-acetyltransferase
MHYAKDSKNPGELIKMAFNYFKAKNMKKIDAYFQCFGMGCYARHGKLHESQFYIEDLLNKYSFINNEENVYFSKDLNDCNICNDSEIICEIEHENSKGIGIKFLLNGEQIGTCGLSFLHSNISYLCYLETFEKYRGQGLGRRCMNNVFYILKQKNIHKVETDTYTAADFYTKIGMINKGLTRSYITYIE